MICRFFLEVAALAVYFIVVVVTTPSGLPIFSFVVFLFFFVGHIPRLPGFAWPKNLLVCNLCYTTRARILSDYNIFCTLKGERTTVESNAYGTFLVVVSNSGC